MKKIAIICIPFAGGNKSSFLKLKELLPLNFEFVTVELPGRGSRYNEKLLTNIYDVVEDIYKQTLPYLNRKFLLYGHSMGGILGNLLIKKLNKEKKPLPLHFIITGCRSPIDNSSRENIAELPDKDFIIELKKLGGMSPEIINNKELINFFLPIIRSDINILEQYQYEESRPYEVPLTVIAGSEEGLEKNDLLGWHLETNTDVNISWLKGDHFFIFLHFSRIAELIIDKFSNKNMFEQ